MGKKRNSVKETTITKPIPRFLEGDISEAQEVHVASSFKGEPKTNCYL